MKGSSLQRKRSNKRSASVCLWKIVSVLLGALLLARTLIWFSSYVAHARARARARGPLRMALLQASNRGHQRSALFRASTRGALSTPLTSAHTRGALSNPFMEAHTRGALSTPSLTATTSLRGQAIQGDPQTQSSSRTQGSAQIQGAAKRQAQVAARSRERLNGFKGKAEPGSRSVRKGPVKWPVLGHTNRSPGARRTRTS